MSGPHGTLLLAVEVMVGGLVVGLACEDVCQAAGPAIGHCLGRNYEAGYPGPQYQRGKGILMRENERSGYLIPLAGRLQYQGRYLG